MTFTPSMRNATLEDRLAIVRQRLVALEGAVRLLAMDEKVRAMGIGDAQVISAALDDLARCDDELTWLENLPQHVLNLPAPTTDEADEKKRAAGGFPKAGAR